MNDALPPAQLRHMETMLRRMSAEAGGADVHASPRLLATLHRTLLALRSELDAQLQRQRPVLHTLPAEAFP